MTRDEQINVVKRTLLILFPEMGDRIITALAILIIEDLNLPTERKENEQLPRGTTVGDNQ